LGIDPFRTIPCPYGNLISAADSQGDQAFGQRPGLFEAPIRDALIRKIKRIFGIAGFFLQDCLKFSSPSSHINLNNEG
jgi:hypothetical protein